MTPIIEYWRQIKKEKKLTNQEISEKSGIPIGSIKNIFAGYTDNPRLDTIQAIEKALEITNSTTETSISQKNTSLTKKQTQLLTAFDQLIPELQDYIIETTEKLLAKMQGNKKYNKGNAHGNF